MLQFALVPQASPSDMVLTHQAALLFRNALSIGYWMSEHSTKPWTRTPDVEPLSTTCHSGEPVPASSPLPTPPQPSVLCTIVGTRPYSGHSLRPKYKQHSVCENFLPPWHSEVGAGPQCALDQDLRAKSCGQKWGCQDLNLYTCLAAAHGLDFHKLHLYSYESLSSGL